MNKWELQLPANSVDFIVSIPDIYELMMTQLVRELWIRIYQEDTQESFISLEVKQILLEE